MHVLRGAPKLLEHRTAKKLQTMYSIHPPKSDLLVTEGETIDFWAQDKRFHPLPQAKSTTNK